MMPAIMLRGQKYNYSGNRVQGAMGSLRALLRHCAALRAALPSAQDPLLPSLNILIAITGAFFGQDETLAGTWEETKTPTD